MATERRHTNLLTITSFYLYFALVLSCSGQYVTGPEYFLDVLVVCDVPVYTAWLSRARAGPGQTARDVALTNIRQYLTLVMTEVNSRFATLERHNNFRLTVRPVGFVIAETPQQSVWTEAARTGGARQVDAQRALRNLGRWVARATGLPRHDHAMLFTGYDLVTDDSGVVFRYTIGRAVVGTMCDGGGRSVSIVEDRGAFQSVHTAVHELGHSLGALHDGTGNTCRARDRFIMAGGTSPRTANNERNPWFFSPCSAREIATFVRRTLDNRGRRLCLLTALPEVNVPNVQGIIPGQLYNPHEQCQHIYGPRSRYCFGGNFGDLEEICTSMFCLNPKDEQRNFCVQHHAARGTSCGNGKWCEAGACVFNQNAPANLGQCPLGDQLIMINGRSCSEAVARRPRLCYDRRVRNICCGACARSANPNRAQGCQFGDRAPGCRADLCNTLWPDGTLYANRCCRTCRFDPSRWTCADRPQGVDGLACEAAVWRDGVQGCYNVTLAFVCCSTCNRLRDPRLPTGCEYGNLIPASCPAEGGNRQQCSPQLRQQCCASCRDDDVTGAATQTEISLRHLLTASCISLLIWMLNGR